MLDEVLEELAAGPARRLGPADLRVRDRAAHAVHGVIVQLVKLLGRPLPVADIRLVPGLPPPPLDLFVAVALRTMLRPLETELAPSCVVLRRVRLPAVDGGKLAR